MAYDLLLAAWQGEMGGRDPAAAYRRFVEAGLKDPPVNPFRSAAHGWLLGSDQFVNTIRKQIRDPRNADEVPAAKRLRGLELAAVLKVVAEHYHVSADQLGEARRGDRTRATAAWFARRYTSATRREISIALGLSHPDIAGNMVRRIERKRVASARLRKDLAAIEKQLVKPRTGPDPYIVPAGM